MSFWVVIGIGCAVLLALVLLVRLYFTVRKLQGSIAKLGYIIREDAKRYFDEAAVKITETNESSRQNSVEVIAEASKRALAESSIIVEQTIARAQQDSGKIILEARETARKITQDAQIEADKKYQRVIDESSTTIRWVLEQYAGQKLTQENHELIIKKLFQDYMNENRQ